MKPKHLATVGCLFSLAVATPVSSNLETIAKRDLDPVSVFRGMYWDEAKTTCTADEYNILVEATRMADEMVNKFSNQNQYWDAAAWHRYFVRDWKIPLHGWHYDQESQDTFINIRNNIAQAAKFPKSGKKNKQGKWVRSKQLSYRCKPPGGLATPSKCAQAPNQYGKWTGPTASTYRPIQNNDEGWLVEFCPRFFKDGNLRYLNDITKTKKSESSLATMRSFEYVISHEWMHAQLFGYKFFIEDVKGNIPGQPDGQTIYGDSRCHEWAWKNFKNGQVIQANLQTAYNADSYAWMYQYNWYWWTFQWYGSDGSKSKRSLETGEILARDDSTDIGDPIDDDDNLVDESKVDLTQSNSIPINCKPGTGDPSANGGNNDWTNNLECAYVGEEYSDFVNDVNTGFTSDGGCQLSKECNLPYMDGFAIDPSCTCKCGSDPITPLSDPRCAGFAGNLPNPPSHAGG